MRVKMITDNKFHRKGDIVEVSPNVAFGLIDAGVAILTKDMTESDVRTKVRGRRKRRGNIS